MKTKLYKTALFSLLAGTSITSTYASELTVNAFDFLRPNIYEIGIAPKVSFTDMMIIIANDESGNMTEEHKLKFIADNLNPQPSPFELRKNPAEFLAKYQETIEKAKDILYSDTVKVIDGMVFKFPNTTEIGYQKGTFEKYYDFEKEIMYFDICHFCSGDFSNLVDSRTKIALSEPVGKRAYFKLPADIAEKLFFSKEKRSYRLASKVDYVVKNNKKLILESRNNIYLSTVFESGVVRIYEDTKERKELYRAEVQFEK